MASTRARIGVAALLLAIAMTNVAYTMLIALVPELTGRFGMSTLAVAAAFSGFALAKAVAQPVGGVLGDRLPRPPVLAFALQCLTAGAVFGLAFASSGWQVLVWRLAWGMAEGLAMPVLYGLVSTLGADTGLGTTRVMSWFAGAAVTGMAAGPALVGLLHSFLGFTGVFLAGGSLTAVSGVLLLTIRSRPVEELVEKPEVRRASPATLAVFVGIFAAIDLLNNVLYAAMEPVLPLHIEATSRADALRVTSALFTAGLVVFGIVSVTCARFVERWPLLVVTAVAFWASAAGLLVIGVVGGVAAVAAGFVVFMATEPVLYVVARRGVSLVPADRLGRAYGAFGLVSDIGFIVGPTVGSLLYGHLGAGTFVALAGLAAATGLGALPARRLPDRLLAEIEPASELRRAA